MVRWLHSSWWWRVAASYSTWSRPWLNRLPQKCGTSSFGLDNDEEDEEEGREKEKEKKEDQEGRNERKMRRWKSDHGHGNRRILTKDYFCTIFISIDVSSNLQKYLFIYLFYFLQQVYNKYIWRPYVLAWSPNVPFQGIVFWERGFIGEGRFLEMIWEFSKQSK